MKAAWAANRKAQVDCGEILWPQRGCLGGPHPQPLSHFAGESSQVDMPVRPGNEHPLDHAAVKVDTGSTRRAHATKAGRGKGASGQAAAETDHTTPAERGAAMTWAQRLKRVFNTTS